MSNETMQVLLNRKSVRVFEETPIPQEVKQAILDAAMRAPTAGNSMMYSIIDVTDQAIKDKLAVSCDGQKFIATAPLILIFCADYHRWMRKYKQAGCEDLRKPELSDLILAANDTVIAAHTACIAAESFGVGSCYIGDILECWEVHQELLQLPEHVAPVSMLVFGYPTKQQKEREQRTRFPQKMIVFENNYRELEEDELMEYRSDEQAKAFCKRKFLAAYSLERLRSVKEIYKNWNQD